MSMCVGQVSLAGNGSKNFTPSDFTSITGVPLSSGDAVIIRTIIFSNTVTINRTGDPDEDGTFEISVQYTSEASAGERHSENRIITQYAGLEMVDTSGSSNPVTVIGEKVDLDKVVVKQAQLSNGTTLRLQSIASRAWQASVYEIVHSTDYQLMRKHDPDDDGTFETDIIAESVTGAGVETGRWHLLLDRFDRNNREMWLGIYNNSGGSGDYMMFGTIGMAMY